MEGYQAKRTQVELFDANTRTELQELINRWLLSQDLYVSVLFINYTTSPVYSAMIIYCYEKSKSVNIENVTNVAEKPVDDGTSDQS